jgi:hypothetical protein
MERTNRNERMATVAIWTFFVIFAATAGLFVDSYYASGATSWNVSTRLNVTNTEPTTYQVIFDDLTPSPSDIIILNAGATTEVICNGSAYDPNGQSDLVNATATIYASEVGRFGTTSKFNRYDNNSCVETYDVAGTTTNRSIICRFNVDYWAYNTTWECNFTVRDNGGTQLVGQNRISMNSSKTDQAVIYQLTAINVSSQILDFGNLSVTETSPDRLLNVTNVGNFRTNFTVMGYGGNDSTVPSANLSCMLCQTNNISLNYMRFSNVSGVTWDNMIPLNGTEQMIQRITLQNRTDENNPIQFGVTTNATYWKIRVPLSVGGLCNGTLRFSATSLSS